MAYWILLFIFPFATASAIDWNELPVCISPIQLISFTKTKQTYERKRIRIYA